MNVTAWTLAVVLTFGQGPPTMDVSGYVMVETELLPGDFACGMAPLPFLILESPSPGCDNVYPGDTLRQHEEVHYRQWHALGPALPIALALNAGRDFEDYVQDETMWDPAVDNPELEGQCPDVRISSEGVSILPCWRF